MWDEASIEYQHLKRLFLYFYTYDTFQFLQVFTDMKVIANLLQVLIPWYWKLII